MKIKLNDLNKVSYIMIPIEKNEIFTSPIIKLIIKELELKLTLKLGDIYINHHRKYGMYHTIEKNYNIIMNDNIENLTIDIRGIQEIKYNKIDVLKVNLLEINGNEIIFTCSTIYYNDYLEGDFIQIIHNDDTFKKKWKIFMKLKY